MSCTTGCPTKTCESYAACLRGKRSRVAYCNSAGNSDFTQQKKWDADITAYKDARAQGLQPATTKRADVDRAHAISDITGSAFVA